MKRRMMNKMTAAILTMVMILTLAPASAFAANNKNESYIQIHGMRDFADNRETVTVKIGEKEYDAELQGETLKVLDVDDETKESIEALEKFEVGYRKGEETGKLALGPHSNGSVNANTHKNDNGSFQYNCESITKDIVEEVVEETEEPEEPEEEIVEEEIEEPEEEIVEEAVEEPEEEVIEEVEEAVEEKTEKPRKTRKEKEEDDEAPAKSFDEKEELIASTDPLVFGDAETEETVEEMIEEVIEIAEEEVPLAAFEADEEDEEAEELEIPEEEVPLADAPQTGLDLTAEIVMILSALVLVVLWLSRKNEEK